MNPRFQADSDFNQKIIAGLRGESPLLTSKPLNRGMSSAGLTPKSFSLRLGSVVSWSPMIAERCRRASPDLYKLSRAQDLSLFRQELDIGTAIGDLLLIWAASESEEWKDIGFVPI